MGLLASPSLKASKTVLNFIAECGETKEREDKYRQQNFGRVKLGGIGTGLGNLDEFLEG